MGGVREDSASGAKIFYEEAFLLSDASKFYLQAANLDNRIAKFDNERSMCFYAVFYNSVLEQQHGRPEPSSVWHTEID
jgi:hypothetical protein